MKVHASPCGNISAAAKITSFNVFVLLGIPDLLYNLMIRVSKGTSYEP